MGFKKLAYIFFILLLSILHTITLTKWLDADSDLIENNDATNLKINLDSTLNAKRTSLNITADLDKIHK